MRENVRASSKSYPAWPYVFPALLVAVLAARPIYRLTTGLWQTDDHAFSPMLVLIGAAMAAQITRRGMTRHQGANGGIVLVCAGLLMLVLGNLLGNIFLEFTGIIPTICGLVAYFTGWTTLQRYWAPILIWCFAIPLPGAVITELTFPLKMSISKWATDLLFAVGLPVAREGVVIDIGNYRLLVADACSGLQSMFSLVSVSVVYVYLLDYRQRYRVGFLIAAALPIVIFVNLLRVVALALLTYWFGVRVSEGPLHAAAGFGMFAAALVILLLFDDLYGVLWRRSKTS